MTVQPHNITTDNAVRISLPFANVMDLFARLDVERSTDWRSPVRRPEKAGA